MVELTRPSRRQRVCSGSPGSKQAIAHPLASTGILHCTDGCHLSPCVSFVQCPLTLSSCSSEPAQRPGCLKPISRGALNSRYRVSAVEDLYLSWDLREGIDGCSRWSPSPWIEADSGSVGVVRAGSRAIPSTPGLRPQGTQTKPSKQRN